MKTNTKTTSNEIRSYGPGKFSTILDSYVYDVTLQGGCDDEISTDYGFWAGLMSGGRSIFQDHDPLLESLNQAEQDMLTGCPGVIVIEDSNGFVYVEYYNTDDQLARDWAGLHEEHDAFTDDDENDD